MTVAAAAAAASRPRKPAAIDMDTGLPYPAGIRGRDALKKGGARAPSMAEAKEIVLSVAPTVEPVVATAAAAAEEGRAGLPPAESPPAELNEEGKAEDEGAPAKEEEKPATTRRSMRKSWKITTF
jgi:hypothetical protein